MKRAAILGAAVVWVVGCGGETDHPKPIVSSNDSGGKAATGGRRSVAGAAGRAGAVAQGGSSGAATTVATAGRAGGANRTAGAAGTLSNGGTDNLAGASGQVTLPMSPIVTIGSPLEVTDPNAASGVLSGDSVDVTCSIAKGPGAGATIDPSSLKIQIAQGSKTYDPTSSNPAVDNSVKQKFTLTGLEAGPAKILCSGSDKSKEPLTSETEINTLIDPGPVITPAEPKDRAPWNVATPVTVRFSVTPRALPNLASIVDSKAEIDPATVLVAVNGKNFPAIPTAVPGEYSVVIHLNSTTDFPAADFPSGQTALRIDAYNRRGVRSSSTLTINVDSVPPVISVKSPDPTQTAIIGGNSQLVFEVSDPGVGNGAGTGVDLTSVAVVINTKSESFSEEKIHRWTHTQTTSGNLSVDRFVFSFARDDFPSDTAQVTVQVVASDNAGNPTTTGRTDNYVLDTTPPIVDLDPPTVREVLKQSGAFFESSAFDPLGNAVNDMEVISGDNFFRVLAWEKANPSELEYLAGIDNTPTSTTDSPVQIWLQPNVDQPLLVDLDGDSYCDEINRTGTPPPIPFNLVPIAPTGTAPVIAEASNGDDLRYGNTPEGDGLTGYPRATVAPLPEFLCSGASIMSRVIKHSVRTTTPTPVVYGLGVLDTIACTGKNWAIAEPVYQSRKKYNGWICAAAKAVDRVGNVGVSPIIRLCLDTNKEAHPSCATNLQPTPSADKIPSWVTAWAGTEQKRLTPPKSAEAFTCPITCKMRPQRYVRYVPNY
jgi:hypothetical protein